MVERLDLGKLKERMESKGFNHSSLSRAAGLPRLTVWRTVKGITSPTLNTLSRICEVLNLKVGDLLND